MAGTVREAKLHTPTARWRLKAGRMAHWNALVPGRSHLGYQRKEEAAAGRWILRKRRGDDYSIEPLGIADDRDPANGVTVLDYLQARDRAVERSMDNERSSGRLTVQRTMADYINFLVASGKNTATAESSAVCHILPALGHYEVASLTSAQIRQWVASLVEGSSAPEGHLTDEQIRRRQVSANRHLSVLKAALNHAYDENRVPNNSAWGRRVKKCRGVDSTSGRYMTVAECKRFLDACDEVFRPLARAALETGMRYSELARLVVGDFNKVSGTVHVRKSKSAKQRHVILTPEGVAFFSDATAGRLPHEIIFTKADGDPWGHGNQGWYVNQANKKGTIEPPIHFHLLRHAWASLAVMNAVPLVVVAKNLGHVNTRMVERVYGHLAPSFIVDAIRTGAPRFV